MLKKLSKNLRKLSFQIYKLLFCGLFILHFRIVIKKSINDNKVKNLLTTFSTYLVKYFPTLVNRQF